MNKRLVLSLMVGILIALYCDWMVYDVGALLQGPGWSKYGDSFNLYEIVLWIFLYSPVWFLGLWQCETELDTAHMSAYRHKKLSVWWLRVILDMGSMVVIPYIVMWGLLFLLKGSEWTGIQSMSMLLITIHALAMISVAIWIRLMSGKMILAAIVILILEVLTKLLIVVKIIKPWYSVFSFGMYSYSKGVYGKNGFVVSIAIAIQVLIIISLSLFSIGKLKEILLGRISDEKNN